MKDLRKVKYLLIVLLTAGLIVSCSSDDSDTIEIVEGEGEVAECDERDDYTLVDVPGTCDVDLGIESIFTMVEVNGNRAITANNIPEHLVGSFPNANVLAQENTYSITLNPVEAADWTPLLDETGINYSFGILLNGIELDPIAAEPWPHSDLRAMDPDANWSWNLEALNVRIALDCNYSHVQPTGQYHSHGAPGLYDKIANATGNEMVLIGYAADGYPLYYKYAYETASDNTSSIIAMSSSYQLKTGNRPGDGVTAPCSEFDGAYSADYEYIDGLGTLDLANGRTGVTPEFLEGTYYYILTDGDEFPSIPRYFRGTPSADFAIGGGNN